MRSSISLGKNSRSSNCNMTSCAFCLSSGDVMLFCGVLSLVLFLVMARSTTAIALVALLHSEKRSIRSSKETLSVVSAVRTSTALTSGSFGTSSSTFSLMRMSFSHRKVGPGNQFDVIKSAALKPLDAWSAGILNVLSSFRVR